jgi:hypothetical protein
MQQMMTTFPKLGLVSVNMHKLWFAWVQISNSNENAFHIQGYNIATILGPSNCNYQVL